MIEQVNEHVVREQFFRERQLLNQLDYYQTTAREYQVAEHQIQQITTVLLAIGAVCSSILQSQSVLWLSALAGGLCLLCSILVQALAAYSHLYAFARQASLYNDIVEQLDKMIDLEGDALVSGVQAVLSQELRLWHRNMRQQLQQEVDR